MFTVLFSVYLMQRGKAPELFAQSQSALHVNLGATNTVVLLASSLLVVFATQAFRRDQLRRHVPRLLMGAVVLGLVFVVVKAFEYSAIISAGLTPNTNQFYMYYFVLTGLHLVHVLAGLAVLLLIKTLARRPTPSATHIALFECGACFWHLVDLLWIVIFPLLYLVR